MGVDVSTKMVDLASERLARFGDRATIELVNGEPPLPGETGRFDRFVALYVFDLLPETLAVTCSTKPGDCCPAMGGCVW